VLPFSVRLPVVKEFDQWNSLISPGFRDPLLISPTKNVSDGKGGKGVAATSKFVSMLLTFFFFTYKITT
jgi:hypothetical protein